MDDHRKFTKAIKNLGAEEYAYHGEAPVTEELFNKIEWVTGVAENETSITTTVNPHSHLTWVLVNAEMDNVQAEYDAQDYARKRKEEYPSIQECVHAILDDDLDNLQVLRQAVKDKYPKD